jgi:hypothetical protein
MVDTGYTHTQPSGRGQERLTTAIIAAALVVAVAAVVIATRFTHIAVPIPNRWTEIAGLARYYAARH